MNIIVFSGTSDGNEIVGKLSKLGHNVIVSVATDYAKDFLIDYDVTVLSGRLDIAKIVQVISQNDVNCIIDATHPYATEVSGNINSAFIQVKENSNSNIEKFRLLREQSLYEEHITLVDDIKTACDKTVAGNVLATTGSKQIHEYTTLVDYKTRLYSRVLPTEESVQLCKKAGLDESKIIQSLGALSVEENVETIRRYNIKNLITKDGGVKGGFPQKSEACKLTDTKLIVIKRPKETTEFYSTDEIFSSILKEIN